MDEEKWKQLEFLLDSELGLGTDEDIVLTLYTLLNTIVDNTKLPTFTIVGILETMKERLIDEILEEYKNDS